MASSARIDELRKKFDDNPRRYFAPLANEYRKAGDLDQAIFICQEYLPQQPGHMSGHIVYAQTLFEMARHEEAKAVFETALSLDPENLIALRHLGDIARQEGDSNAARIWYQRVLEADPRNEEIAEIMIALLAEPESGTAAVRAPTPMSTPVVAAAVADESLTVPARAPWTLNQSADGEIEIEKSVDKTQLEASEPAPAAAAPTNETNGHEWLDLNDLTIGGVAMGAPVEDSHEADATHGAADAPVGRAFETEDEMAADPSDQVFVAFSSESSNDGPLIEEPQETTGFELGHEDGPFEADPFAIAVTSDNEYKDPNTGTVAPVSDEAIAAAAFDAEPTARVEGLEEFEAGFMSPATPMEGLETTGFFDVAPAQAETTEPHDAAAHAPTNDVSAEPAEAPVAEWTSESTVLESTFVETPAAESPVDEPAAEPETTYGATSWTSPSVVDTPADEPTAEETFVESSWTESTESTVGETPAAEPIAQSAHTETLWTESATSDTPVDAPAGESTDESADIEALFADSPSSEPAADEPDAQWAGADESTSSESIFVESTTDAAFADASMVESPPAESNADEPTVVEQTVESNFGEAAAVESAPVESSVEQASFVEVSRDEADHEPEHQPHTETWAERAARIEEPAPVEEMFVTETMAELYLRQGHLESAIDIFRKLVDQRPADEALRDRLHVVEAQLFDQRARHFAPTPPAPQESVADETPVASGPTIREFLVGLTVRRPSDTEGSADSQDWRETVETVETYQSTAMTDHADVYAEASVADDFAPDAEHETVAQPRMPAPPLPEARWTTPPTGLDALNQTPRNSGPVKRATPNSSGETVTGSIDALFTGAGSSVADASAASALAEAFAADSAATAAASPLHGVPAHRASNELRLDHVFKANTPPRSDVEDEGFSFDQFFSDDMSDPAAGTPGDGGAPSPESTDDIAQFNAWLNGLKKT
ncbi:MAG: tetratricopeptide repeat protein [bacterium]